VEVILLIDTLEMPEPLAWQERVAVDEFLRQNGGNLTHRVSVFELSYAGLGVIARSLRDGNELARDVDRNREVMLRSAMPHPNAEFSVRFDPPQLVGVRALGQIATEERRRPGRKVLLWVGPGTGTGTGKFDEGSHRKQDLLDTANWFSTLLREARIALYTFSVGESDARASLNAGLSDLPATRSLHWQNFLEGAKTGKQVSWMHMYKNVLAVQSGGRAFEPRDDLAALMNRCIEEASVLYTLSFDPPLAEHFDEYHDLHVQIGQTVLTARTNTGYYDQPYYTDRANPAVRPVTVEQLDSVLTADHGESDAAVARELASSALTERLSAAKLSAWTAEFRGEKTRQALVALADASAFLDPPEAEIPADAAPEPAAQQQMMVHAVDYLNAAIPKLPNIFATRTTVRYEEALQPRKSDAWLASQPLGQVDSTKATVVYRQGNEFAEVDARKASRKLKAGDSSLTANGTFGPLLSAAAEILAVPESLHWSRWGQGPAGRVAVFRYVIPAEKLSYHVGGCCLPDGEGTNAFRTLTTFQGEIEIDPASGTLIRLELEANLKSTTPLVRSDVMIEYGPVVIGGKTYICPLRSVSISRVRSVNFFRLWDEGFRTYGPYSTLLNDMEFGDYHVFRSKSQIQWDRSGSHVP
jgi:VWFA-related protein